MKEFRAPVRQAPTAQVREAAILGLIAGSALQGLEARAAPGAFAVGFSSPAGTGKDTIAAVFIQEGAKRLSVGDILRDIAWSLGYDLELFSDRALKETPREDMNGMTPRELLLSIGNWGRSISPTFWLDRLRATMPPSEFGYVFTDVGSEAEAAFVREFLGGIIVRLERDVPHIDCGRTFVEPDVVIPNHGTPEEAAAAIREFINGRSK